MNIGEDGGYEREQQHCMYKNKDCVFGEAIPEGDDSAHVDMGQLYANDMAIQPLMALRKVRYTNILMSTWYYLN